MLETYHVTNMSQVMRDNWLSIWAVMLTWCAHQYVSHDIYINIYIARTNKHYWYWLIDWLTDTMHLEKTSTKWIPLDLMIFGIQQVGAGVGAGTLNDGMWKIQEMLSLLIVFIQAEIRLNQFYSSGSNTAIFDFLLPVRMLSIVCNS